MLNTFSKLNIEFGDPPTPPNWVLRNSGLFGAYLAGIIDGDGSIRAINKYRPQMRIKVTSGKTQSELAKVIKERFSCWVKITKREKDSILKGRKIHGKFYELEFNVSGKNYKFIYKYILPHLALQYKKERLQSFIVNRFIYGVVG